MAEEAAEAPHISPDPAVFATSAAAWLQWRTTREGASPLPWHHSVRRFGDMDGREDVFALETTFGRLEVVASRIVDGVNTYQISKNTAFRLDVYGPDDNLLGSRAIDRTRYVEVEADHRRFVAQACRDLGAELQGM